jgi:hypothetical protein
MSKSIYLKEDFINQQTLTEALSADVTHGIYVVNTSYEQINSDEFDSINVKHPLERFAETGIKGVVFIEVPSEKGQHPNTISVPAVDIPFDLVEFGSSAQDILESVSFKGALKKGALSLLSKAAYERISTNPVVVNKRNILRETMGTRVFGVADDKTDVINKLNKDLGSAVTKGAKTGSKELSPVVVELCNPDVGISHSDQYKKFLIVEDKLTKQDLMYLIEQCPVTKIKEQAELNLTQE